MIYTRHSHCFSKSQLEIIIDGYLSLTPYYTVLLKALKSSTQKHQSNADPHRTDKPHPIRVYTREHQCCKNVLDEEGQNIVEPRGDLRSTYASTNIKYFYLFPLEYVIEILSSADFYNLLPQNLIINGLLTATNLQIIIQTLNIVSQDMCKKIRSTIAGKQLALSSPEQDPVLEENKSFASFRNQSTSQQLPLSSIVNIAVEDQEDLLEVKPLIPEKSSKLIKREIAGTRRFITIDREISQNQCRFCQGYLIYLYETVGENPLDEDINRLSMEASRCLNIISKAVPHFTLYLSISNQLQIPNDVYLINKIINPMGLVITEQIFTSELNPKNTKPSEPLHHRPKNLIEELQPFFKTLEKKKTNSNYFSIEELFRMLIYSPTTEQVNAQLKQQKVDQFEKERGQHKNCLKNDRVKTLLGKQCAEMEAFQKERLKIAQNMVDIRPIFKQLQFPEEPLQSPNTKPSQYNVFNPSSKHNQNKFLSNERSLTAGTHGTHYNHQKSDNKTLMLELSNSISRTEDSKGSKLKKSSRKYKQKKNKNGDDLNIPDFGALAMSAVFKRSAIKNPQQTQTNNNWLTVNNLPQNLTTSTEIIETSLKGHSDVIQQEQELSDIQFKKMLYSNYNKKHIAKPDNTAYFTISSAKPSDQAGGTPSTFKGKKNNIYSNSLSTFIGRKQEQQQLDCIEKKEKETFNKQLLNGQFIKNEIYSELKNGTAIVCNDYTGTLSLNDTFKLERRIPTDSSKIEDISTKVRIQSPHSISSKKCFNVIDVNSAKYNETGIIRNEKYSKCIKNELINNRSSFFKTNQKQNQSKQRLAQTHLHSRQKQEQTKKMTFMDIYQRELKAAIEERKIRKRGQSSVDQQYQDIEQILI